MEQIHKSKKNCATCAYWLGERVPHLMGHIEVKSSMATGRCGARGLNDPREYQAIYNCSKYVRWQVIKQLRN